MKRSELEYRALEEVREASREQRQPVELVAIGFKFGWTADVVWRLLPNSAMRGDRFLVEASSLYEELKAVKAEYGIVKTADVEYAALWHSHNVHEMPSSVDIREFPGHLVKVGFVYHTPTRTTRAYDASGQLSPITPGQLVTTEV